MGSVMRGEQVTKLRIFNLLTIIGADCECDLDYSWILGDMIPLRWDYQDLEKLAEQLDFNVENPMVKSEMSQILSLKPNPENAMNPMENNLLGYTEGDFGLGKDNIASPKISASEIRESFYPSDSHKTNQVFKMLLITLGGVIFIVLIISALLLIRHKQRKI